MFRKNYFSFFLAVALIFAGGTSLALAQASPVRGKVLLKKADGTTEPVVGATIDAYRTDVKGKSQPAKTDKNGNFAFAGFPVGQVFALAVSAPNVEPSVYPNIKSGMEGITIKVVPGDGRRYTEDEARQALTAAPSAGSQTSSSGGKPAEPTADQKKAAAEQAKKAAEYETEKKNVEASNAVINKSYKEGLAAFDAKNYDLAIAKYDEGIAAAPDYEGSAPLLLNKKALTLNNRATTNYNQSTKADATTKLAALESVKKDLQTALDSANRSLEILAKAPATTDANEQKKRTLNKFDAMKARNETYRLLGRTGADRSKAQEANAAFQEYLAAETEPALKSAAQLTLAQVLQDANEFDMAVVEFRKILEVDPNNVEALGGIGFSLVNVGYISNDKTKFQEAANYLQKFADLAPDTNPLKAGAKETIETLKTEQSVAPQKAAKTTTTKKKP